MIPIATFFPPQKKTDKEKNLEWMKSCVDGAQDIAIYHNNSSIRESMYNKQVNYNLYNDILDESDIHRTINPFGISGANFPAKMQNYPICNPKIDLLVGEESSRRFDWRCRVMNMNAIMDKQQMIKDRLMTYIIQKIQSGGNPNDPAEQQKTQEELAKLEKWKNYEAQDIREIRATESLTYLYREQEMKLKFNMGMYDVLISGEEQYCIDMVASEPIVRKVNPLNLFTIRQGESPYTEDCDIVIEYGYFPIGEIIDRHYEYLKPAEIDQIEEGHVWNKGVSVVNYSGRSPILLSEMTETDSDTGALIEVNTKATKYFGGTYDTAGNIRVVRTVWKSLRKIGKLKFYDKEGNAQETIVDERYTPNKDAGEEITWLWINEWWEGTKIGQDIYVKMGPRPVQFRSMTNLSKCASGYVGTAYNVNNSKAKSLMDRLRPYQYLYNTFMYRTELAFAKSMGKIGKLDLSRVPEGWDIDKWLYYAQTMGWAIEDPFREGNKGVATGKLAGNMNQSSAVIDLEMGAYIQQHILMLDYIERQMGIIGGISAQREAQIQNRETNGGINTAIQQSSYITEHWFLSHDNTKLRVMSCLLETAKEAWRGKNIKKQYILDDMSSNFIDIDGDKLRDAEYGVFVNNSTNDTELFSALKGLAHAAIQNDKMSISTLIDIYSSESISQVRRKIEASEEELQQRQIAAEQNKSKEIQDELANKAAIEQEKIDMKKYEIDTDAMTSIQVAQINSFSRQQDQDLDKDLIPDQLEVGKLALEQQKAASSQFDKTTEHRRKELEIKAKQSIDSEKIKTQKEIAKLKAETDRYKADMSYKIAKENKGKYDTPKNKSKSKK
jgi:hypothetical protein